MTTQPVPAESIIKPCVACHMSEIHLTVFKEVDIHMGQVYSIECEKCGVRGPKSKNVSDAIRKWNKLPRIYDQYPDYKVPNDEPEV